MSPRKIGNPVQFTLQLAGACRIKSFYRSCESRSRPPCSLSIPTVCHRPPRRPDGLWDQNEPPARTNSDRRSTFSLTSHNSLGETPRPRRSSIPIGRLFPRFRRSTCPRLRASTTGPVVPPPPARPPGVDRITMSRPRRQEFRPQVRPPRRPSGPWVNGALPVIGIVGGIGAGKSLVAAALVAKGAFLLDADVIGHVLLEQSPARDRVLERFGEAILAPYGEVEGTRREIDRRALGSIVFASSAALRDLEAILHPVMRKTFAKAISREVRKARVPAIVLDAAILYEAGWDTLCDSVICVDAPGRSPPGPARASPWLEPRRTPGPREIARPARRKTPGSESPPDQQRLARVAPESRGIPLASPAPTPQAPPWRGLAGR